MNIPFEPEWFGYSINIHLLFEVLAFLAGFQYYRYLRTRKSDLISDSNRWSIIVGATAGAFIGSRLMGFLENPFITWTAEGVQQLLNVKTIMGGLFGGLLGVEGIKKLIGERSSSGDLFTLPIILGIFIGRIGCFLAGTNEFTYGVETEFFAGMDLGDGLLRHPIALYELVFMGGLFWTLRKIYAQRFLANGELFKLFMLAYFGFRFLIEFIKPNEFLVLGLSSIQWLCVINFVYYRHFANKLLHHAGKKLQLL